MIRRVIAPILARRSVRGGFTGRVVEDSLLEQVVACGLAAPSSKNAQPWRMHVVTDPATLAVLAAAVDAARAPESYVPIDPATGERRRWSSTVAESAAVLREAGTAIFVENLGEFSGGRATLAAAEQQLQLNALVGYSFEMIGIGAAVENMWLAAESLGLRGVFMGDPLIAERDIKSLLAIDGDLAGVLAIGYSDAAPEPKRMGEDRVVWHRGSS